MAKLKPIKELMQSVPKITQVYVDRQINIATRVNDFIDENGLSESEFADKVKLSVPRVKQICTGEANLRLREVCQIELAIGKSLFIFEPIVDLSG